jgi:hypothetical protein
MKRLLLSLLIVLFGSFLYAAEPDSVFVNSNPINKDSCTCKGIPLYGRVKVVQSMQADFRVQVVSSFADLLVTKCTSPLRCGEWEFVEGSADFTIVYVSSFPDFTISFVTSFPGVQ